jgi:hypothetical protein
MTTLLRVPRVRTFLGLSVTLIAACGARTESDGQELNTPDSETGGSSSNAGTGGSSWVSATGGKYWTSTGGSPWVQATGGKYWTATGGSLWIPGTGGTTKGYATGGATTGGKSYAPGGTTSTGGKSYAGGTTSTGGKGYAGGGSYAGGTMSTGGKSYTGGATSTGGFSTGGKGYTGGTTMLASGGTSAISCVSVTCSAIPNTCTQIVQPVGACCPTCLNTGCPTTCDPIQCPTGKHLETVAGDCCPSCVADPPDPCTTGQQSYASSRQSMIDKYSSSGCNNSTDCVIVSENNACAFSCGVALPSKMSSSFQSNLDSQAATSCSTCKPPLVTPCIAQVAACVNGKCVAVSPS